MHSPGRSRRLRALSAWAISVASAGLSAQSLNLVQGQSGSFKDESIPIATGGAYVHRAVDITGDGRNEFVLGFGSSFPSPEVAIAMRVLRINATGTGLEDGTRALFGAGNIPARVHPREIVFGDFNHDGKNDLFVAAHGYDAPPFPGERNVRADSSAAGLTDRVDLLPDEAKFSHCATVGRANDDAWPDIYVCALCSGRPYILFGQADGSFSQQSAVLPTMLPDVENGQPIESDICGFLVAEFADLDGDGFDDIALGQPARFRPGTRNIVLFNDGTGDFRNRPPVQLPPMPFTPATVGDIVADDVNRDGRLDLLVLLTQSGSLQDQGSAIQVLVNAGNGQFSDESVARLGASAVRTNGRWSTFLRLADIDRNGATDILSSGLQDLQGSTTTRVPMIWLNRGNGTYCWEDNWLLSPSQFAPWELIDVDSDGRLDFANADIDFFDRELIRYNLYFNRTAGPVVTGLLNRDGFESPSACR